MITFQFSLTNGDISDIYEDGNKILKNVVDDFLTEKYNNNITVKSGIHQGNKIDFQKTLSENNIKNGSNVLLIIDSENINPNPSPQKVNPNLNSPNTNKPSIMQPNMMNPMMMPNMMNPSMMPNMMNPSMMPNMMNPMMMPNMMNPMMMPNMMNPMMFPNMMNPMPLPSKTDKKTNLLICMNILSNCFNIPSSYFSPKGNCLNNSWRVDKKSGPPEGLKEYYPPQGWYGIGLQAWDLYDDKDNTWIGTSNKKGEWYITYHPISSIPSVLGILENGFRRGPYQDLEDEDNLNPLTKEKYPKCGEGVYFIPEIKEAEKYAVNFKYLNYQFKIALMCRVNPYEVRIADFFGKERWIVNGDKLKDPNGKKRDNEVRAYRILILLKS